MNAGRVVVTAAGPDGRSRVVSDGPIEEIRVSSLPGYVWHRLWSQDRPAGPVPDPAVDPAHFAPPGGIRHYHYQVPPGGAPAFAVHDPGEMEAALPGRAEHLGDDPGGMHTTATLDLVTVIAGEILLELDDGSLTPLGPGDTVVQHAAAHAWRNEGAAPCRMVVTQIGFDAL